MGSSSGASNRKTGYLKKMVLPVFEMTEVLEAGQLNARLVKVKGATYYVREKVSVTAGSRIDGATITTPIRYNQLPIPMSADGSPWAEGVAYLLELLVEEENPNMLTFAGMADDLGAYKHFLDSNQLEWTDFPALKLSRPTYRFNGHLKYLVAAGERASTLAGRQMGTVVGMYRWMEREAIFIPSNPPWKEAEVYVQVRTDNGRGFSKKIKTTDLSVKVPQQIDPYSDSIMDGQMLRPLSREEQEWVVMALLEIGNTEMTLIHLSAMLTAARIQTILTLKVKHVNVEIPSGFSGRTAIPVGKGTGVDTKRGKRMALQFPAWFMRRIHQYSLSGRARARREKAKGGDTGEQYLFLSQRGNPLYLSNADKAEFNPASKTRYVKVGQAVRQFMAEQLIPKIRRDAKKPDFRFRFHDLRATAGMNETDKQLERVSQGKITLSRARDLVRAYMGHESSETTERYLNFRHNLKLVREVSSDYEDHLEKITKRGFESK